MNQKAHEEGQFLSVIVCYETDGFHVLSPLVTDDHTEEKLYLMPFETFYDFVLIDCVEDNMLLDNFRSDKYVYIELFLE